MVRSLTVVARCGLPPEVAYRGVMGRWAEHRVDGASWGGGRKRRGVADVRLLCTVVIAISPALCNFVVRTICWSVGDKADLAGEGLATEQDGCTANAKIRLSRMPLLATLSMFRVSGGATRQSGCRCLHYEHRRKLTLLSP